MIFSWNYSISVGYEQYDYYAIRYFAIKRPLARQHLTQNVSVNDIPKKIN